MARYRRGPVVVPAMSGGQRGFALLVVLLTVGFLGLLGTQIVAAGRSDTQLAGNLRQEAVLRAAADGAISDIMFRMLAARDARFQADGAVRELRVGPTLVLVRVENESDRVNLNTASGALLRALISQAGSEPATADRLAAAILDWRTSGANPRRGGAKAADYRAAGLAYGPPGTPFQTVDELAGVLGVTPDLFERVAPHLTVLTDGDPDLSTRDPVVARALTDASGVADDIGGSQQAADQVLRITVTAIGNGAARYAAVVVASADFQNASPHVSVLLHERGGLMNINTAIAYDIR
jgi:general secretion pathway protein K